MKKLFNIILVISSSFIWAQVGINTTQPQAALDVVSDDSGVLLPRMNNTEIINIENPVEGMLIYNTSIMCLMVNIRDYSEPEGPDWRCLLYDSEPLDFNTTSTN